MDGWMDTKVMISQNRSFVLLVVFKPIQADVLCWLSVGMGLWLCSTVISRT